MTNDAVWTAIASPGRLTMDEHTELMNSLLMDAVKTRSGEGNR